MTAGPESMRSLVAAGGRFVAKLLLEPLPVVAACTGHALAAGALVLLAADHRIGAAGDWKIGLNEVAIGMPLPVWAVELARYRMPPSEFDHIVLGPDRWSRRGQNGRLPGPGGRTRRADPGGHRHRRPSGRIEWRGGGGHQSPGPGRSGRPDAARDGSGSGRYQPPQSQGPEPSGLRDRRAGRRPLRWPAP